MNTPPPIPIELVEPLAAPMSLIQFGYIGRHSMPVDPPFQKITITVPRELFRKILLDKSQPLVNDTIHHILHYHYYKEPTIPTICPNCADPRIITTYQLHHWQYGQEPNHTILSSGIPVRNCLECKFSYLDHEAEAIMDCVTQEHIKKNISPDTTCM